MKSLIVLFALILSFKVIAQDFSGLRVVTEDLPPYNYKEGDEVVGTSTEVIKKILKELKLDVKIEVMPWTRAYNLAQNEPNVLLYSMGRNEKREKIFKWVGQIATNKFGLFAKKGNDIKIESLEDAKKYTICDQKDGFREQYLIAQGFERDKNIKSVTNPEQCLKMLLSGRIDLWSGNETHGFYILEKMGKSKDDAVMAFELTGLPSGGYFTAFGLKTSDEVVEKFREALEKVMK